MTDRRLSAYRVLASASRVSILHALQQADGGLPVDEVATAVGLHPNTAREHLDQLVATGFVASQTEPRTTRGRPRLLYRAIERAAAATMDVRAREHLTQLLVAGYGRAMASPADDAEAAGAAWGATLAETAGPSPRGSGSEAGTDALGDRDAPADPAWQQLAALEQHFEDLGFRPEADADGTRIHLRRCPFADLAADRTDVVCSVHLGLARGVLSHVGGPLDVASLEPFVGRHHCVLHLTRTLSA